MIARLVVPLLTFAFVVASAFLVADIVNTVATGVLHTSPAVALPRPVAKRVPSPSPAAQPSVPAPVVTPPPQPSSVPAAKLAGTTTGAYPSAVIVSPGSNEQKLYRPGDDIGGGWRIAGIGPNRVVLTDGRRREVLERKLVETAEPPRTASPVRTPPTPGTAGIRLDPRDVEAAVVDLNKVMTQARVVPYTVNGVIAGYAIFDIVPGSIYTKLGLQNNDIVERVNGVEIRSPEALYQLFQQIRNQPRIALDFSRNGRRETAQIEIR